MADNFLQIIEARLELLLGAQYREKKYLLAVSGGRDSCAMLRVFTQLFEPSALGIAHFNHKTRNSSSDGDEKFVRALGIQHQIAVFVGVNEKTGLVSEEGMREQRLGFLAQMCADQKYDFIVTAHHAQDQFETFVMRLIRGTGLRGLGSIAPTRFPFLRPFLHCSREQIDHYVAKNAISYREDHSNLDTKYFRNRIRHDLVPVWKRNTDWTTFLGRFTSTLDELRELDSDLTEFASEWIRSNVTKTKFWVRASLDAFSTLPSSFRKVVAKTLTSELVQGDLGRKDFDAFDAVVSGRLPGASLNSKLQLSTSCGFLFIQNDTHRKALAAQKVFIQRESHWDCDLLGIRLSLSSEFRAGIECRFFAPGDVKGRKKLKEIFLERRIPQLERQLVPLIARRGSSEILWIYPDPDKRVFLVEQAFAYSSSVT